MYFDNYYRRIDKGRAIFELRTQIVDMALDSWEKRNLCRKKIVGKLDSLLKTLQKISYIQHIIIANNYFQIHLKIAGYTIKKRR